MGHLNRYPKAYHTLTLVRLDVRNVGPPGQVLQPTNFFANKINFIQTPLLDPAARRQEGVDLLSDT